MAGPPGIALQRQARPTRNHPGPPKRTLHKHCFATATLGRSRVSCACVGFSNHHRVPREAT
jgi:hypothetical protein